MYQPDATHMQRMIRPRIESSSVRVHAVQHGFQPKPAAAYIERAAHKLSGHCYGSRTGMKLITRACEYGQRVGCGNVIEEGGVG